MRGAARVRPSVKEVARAAGVSVGTVSNVLNRPEQVTEDMRKRVESAVEELGYVRNSAAQVLRTGVSPLVGVAVLDITNPFFTGAAAGMERRLSQEGCIMVLASTHSDEQVEANLLRGLSGQGVRGVLLTATDPELVTAREIVEKGTPVVLFDSPNAPDDMASVFVDDIVGATQAVKHLLELGHRHIAFLNGPSRTRQARDRLSGVEKAIAPYSDVRLDVHETADFTAEAGRTAVGALLAGSEPGKIPPGFATAIFCANDMLAFGAMTALRDAGILVPSQVSLVGFDDSAIAEQFSVPLTTIRQPMAELGWAAADLLLADAREGNTGEEAPARAPQHLRFEPELIVRKSTAPPRD